MSLSDPRPSGGERLAPPLPEPAPGLAGRVPPVAGRCPPCRTAGSVTLVDGSDVAASWPSAPSGGALGAGDGLRARHPPWPGRHDGGTPQRAQVARAVQSLARTWPEPAGRRGGPGDLRVRDLPGLLTRGRAARPILSCMAAPDQADARCRDGRAGDDMVIVVATPLAPTTYGYSELLRQHRGEAVTDGVVGEMRGHLLQPQHLDPLEEGVGHQLAPGAAPGLGPGLR